MFKLEAKRGLMGPAFLLFFTAFVHAAEAVKVHSGEIEPFAEAQKRVDESAPVVRANLAQGTPTASPASSPTGSPISSPTSSPVPAPTECKAVDDTSWADAQSGRGCTWIAKRAEKRCDIRRSSAAEGSVLAHDGCALSCGKCDLDCHDNANWKDERSSKGCYWVGRKPELRCDTKFSSVANGKVSANNGCPSSCGKC